LKTSTEGSTEILIVASEASSTLYAQRLLEHWQQEGINVRAFGVGNQEMKKLNFEVLGRSEDMAVVGIWEVLAHYSEIKETFYKILTAAKKRQPKFALLLDYPEFNLKLAKKLKILNIPVVFYISPQVWAWRKGRIGLIKKVVSKMLVLFPFEKSFYTEKEVPVEFVGHPLLDELSEKYYSKQYAIEKRTQFGVKADEKLLGMMPGSRQSEINHHLKVQIEVAEKLTQQNKNLKVALFVAPTLDIEKVKEQLPPYSFPLIIVQDVPQEMICMADVVLCKSGTSTLLVGLLEKPLVIMYKMNMFSALMAKMFVNSTKYFGMINIILDEEVGAEFFQEEANVDVLAKAVYDLLSNEDLYNEKLKKLQTLKQKLGSKGATQRVAQCLSPMMESP